MTAAELRQDADRREALARAATPGPWHADGDGCVFPVRIVDGLAVCECYYGDAECGELIVALCHISRDRIPVSALAEEIADVAIMLEQLQIMYDCHEAVDTLTRQKLARLAGRLERTP